MAISRVLKRFFRRADKGLLAVFFIFLVSLPVFLTPWIGGSDRYGYYSFPRSLVIDGNLDMKEEYELYQNMTKPISSVKYDENTGKYYTMFPVGTGVLWTPFFMMGHMVTILTGGVADGYSHYYVLFTSLGSALFGLFGLVLIYKMLRKYFSEAISSLAVITVWLSTSLFYYMFFEPVMSHCFSMSLAALFVSYWHKTLRRRSSKQWLFLGMIGGLLFIVRFQNITWLLIPFLEVVPVYIRGFTGRRLRFPLELFKKNLVFLVGLLFGYLPQMLYFIYSHGYLFRFWEHYNSGKLSVFRGLTNMHNVLFSSNHGLITWTPIILLCLVGVYLFIKKYDRKLGLMLSAVFLLQWFVVSSYERWHGAQSFGNRIFIVFTLLFCLGLASLYTWIRDIFSSRKSAYIVLLLISLGFVLWNFGVMMQYGSRMIAVSGSVPLKEIAYNNLFVMPEKALELIKGFLFNRESFIG